MSNIHRLDKDGYVTIQINHNHIHILQGLVNSCLNEDILSDADIPASNYYQILSELSLAHDKILQKMEDEL